MSHYQRFTAPVPYQGDHRQKALRRCPRCRLPLCTNRNGHFWCEDKDCGFDDYQDVSKLRKLGLDFPTGKPSKRQRQLGTGWTNEAE